MTNKFVQGNLYNIAYFNTEGDIEYLPQAKHIAGGIFENTFQAKDGTFIQIENDMLAAVNPACYTVKDLIDALSACDQNALIRVETAHPYDDSVCVSEIGCPVTILKDGQDVVSICFAGKMYVQEP